MPILVNYGKEDKPFMAQLATILKASNLQAVSTAKDLTLGELLSTAASTNCTGILVNNEATLRHLVPGDKPTVDKWRGSRLNFRTGLGNNVRSIPTIICNKFSHINTVPHGRWLLEKDLAKFHKSLIPSAPFKFKVILNKQDMATAYAELSRAKIIVCDAETKTFSIKNENNEGRPEEVGDTVITCNSWTGIYGDLSLRTYVLPLIDFDVDHWDNDADYAAALLFMRRVNKLAQYKCAHNGMYDSTHYIRYHAEPVNYVLDTMAFAHAEYAELPKTLDFVASYQLYDYIFWKDDAEQAAKDKDIQKYWSYNAKDTWHTARILIEQLRTMPAYAFANYKAKFKTIYPALYCNFEGLLIDQNKRTELRTKSVTQLKKAEASIRAQFDDPNFNPGSWQQVEKYIYRVLGASKPNLGQSKSCTDEMNLKAVAQQHPLLSLVTQNVLNYREAQKAIGTYYDYLQFRGRLLYALNPFGTESERMAASASSLWCGTQVQNIPAYAKECLVADPGFELFEADNKQSEGRTTAYCAQDETLIAALEDSDRDFYKVLGNLFFNIPYEKVTKEFRNKVIKRIVHGSNYMMGPGTFINNVIKEVEEGLFVLYKAADELGIKITPMPERGKNQMNLKQFVTMLLDSYHKPFKRIRVWYGEIKSEIDLTGFLVSPLGHHRRFFGDIKRDHNMLRSAVAHQPQNLSVSILDKGFNRIYRELVLPGNGNIRLKAQIHDSVFGQIRKGMRDIYGPRILQCMDNPITVHGRVLRIPVDIKFGHNWKEYDEKKNPLGCEDWKPATVKVA